MNFKRVAQGFFLSLFFIFIMGFFWWGMQWFSSSIDGFFQLELGQSRKKNIAGLSASLNSENKVVLQEFPYRDKTASELELDAQSVISVQNDFVNPEKILFEKNAQEKVPIASLTKLMTAIVVLENFDLSKNVKISKNAETQDTRKILKAGDSFIAKDLLYDMLIESDNGAAYAFFEAIGPDKFIKAMNFKANEIGLENTYFSSATGLALTNYSTAKDLANFAEYILNNNNLILDITSTLEFDLYTSNGVFHHKANNLNELLKDAELKDRIVAGKTGQTKDAGECLLIILKAPEDRGYIINVILNAKDRFVEMKKIINWENTAYIWN